mmetsp:Transcript_17181/g.28551  ORF Transcript_17181/g.28551 Transcript_17181/m.28551 type:complete len:203 (+) Transcript_17181:33-641(+)
MLLNSLLLRYIQGLKKLYRMFKFAQHHVCMFLTIGLVDICHDNPESFGTGRLVGGSQDKGSLGFHRYQNKRIHNQREACFSILQLIYIRAQHFRHTVNTGRQSICVIRTTRQHYVYDVIMIPHGSFPGTNNRQLGVKGTRYAFFARTCRLMVVLCFVLFNNILHKRMCNLAGSIETNLVLHFWRFVFKHTEPFMTGIDNLNR